MLTCKGESCLASAQRIKDSSLLASRLHFRSFAFPLPASHTTSHSSANREEGKHPSQMREVVFLTLSGTAFVVTPSACLFCTGWPKFPVLGEQDTPPFPSAAASFMLREVPAGPVRSHHCSLTSKLTSLLRLSSQSIQASMFLGVTRACVLP